MQRDVYLSLRYDTMSIEQIIQENSPSCMNQQGTIHIILFENNAQPYCDDTEHYCPYQREGKKYFECDYYKWVGLATNMIESKDK